VFRPRSPRELLAALPLALFLCVWSATGCGAFTEDLVESVRARG
jgi:hypothetical protein